MVLLPLKIGHELISLTILKLEKVCTLAIAILVVDLCGIDVLEQFSISHNVVNFLKSLVSAAIY